MITGARGGAAACGRGGLALSLAARPALPRTPLEGDAIDPLRTPPENPGIPWQRELRTRIAWTMVVKVLALVLLWLLFFRGHP
jgi:hypothetical protein